MKPALATIIIVAAVLAFEVGSFAMMNMGASNHANCLAAIPGSAACVGGMDPIQFAVTHINAFLGASLGITGSVTLAFFALFVLFARLSIGDVLKDPAISIIASRISFEKTAESITKQRHWISLHERRDPSLVFAAST